MKDCDATILHSTDSRFALYFKGKKVLDAEDSMHPSDAFTVIGCLGIRCNFLQNKSLLSFPDTLAEVDQSKCKYVATFNTTLPLDLNNNGIG